MNNKIFILGAAGLVLADIQGMHPLRDLKSSAVRADRPEPIVFLRAVHKESRIVSSSLYQIFRPANILGRFDDEKAAVISEGMGMSYVPKTKLFSYLKYLGIDLARAKGEFVEDAVEFINKNWQAVRSKIEAQESVWIEMQKGYETELKRTLASYFLGRVFSSIDAVYLVIDMRHYFKDLGFNPDEICDIRYVERDFSRVWQEIHDHWNTIQEYLCFFGISYSLKYGNEEFKHYTIDITSF